jgi:hypothetical protein
VRLGTSVLLVMLALAPLAADVCAAECAQRMSVNHGTASSGAPACHEHANASVDRQLVRSVPACPNGSMLTLPAVQTPAGDSHLVRTVALTVCRQTLGDTDFAQSSLRFAPPPPLPTASTLLSLRI